jgi:hypothetical protein
VASASFILSLRDFSLALARHSSSSIWFLSTCSSNSLSHSSASLAPEEFGSWMCIFFKTLVFDCWWVTFGYSSGYFLVRPAH